MSSLGGQIEELSNVYDYYLMSEETRFDYLEERLRHDIQDLSLQQESLYEHQVELQHSIHH